MFHICVPLHCHFSSRTALSARPLPEGGCSIERSLVTLLFTFLLINIRLASYLDANWLQSLQELVKLSNWWNLLLLWCDIKEEIDFIKWKFLVCKSVYDSCIHTKSFSTRIARRNCLGQLIVRRLFNIQNWFFFCLIRTWITDTKRHQNFPKTWIEGVKSNADYRKTFDPFRIILLLLYLGKNCTNQLCLNIT